MKVTARRGLAALILLCLGLAGSGPAWSQDQMRPMDFAGSLHFAVGFPRGDFKDILDRNAYGVDGQLFYSPQRSPLAIGIEFAYMNYGNETRREPFSLTIPDVTVEVKTSNNIIQGFLVLRAGAKNGPILPYVDGILGLNYLFTETKITDENDPDDEIASSTNSDDAAFAYGLGGGVTIPVYTQSNPAENPFQVSIDVGARFIKGGEATYLKKGSIIRDQGRLEFETSQSKTDMLKLHVGVMFRFGS